MKNELGIEVKCDNCWLKYDCNLPVENACKKDGEHLFFLPSIEASSNRIRELQAQVFTKEEAEKVETFLTHGYQMIANENKEIFSKLEKMKGSERFDNEFEQPKNDRMEIVFGVAIGLALVPMLWLTTIVLYGIFGG